jgi:Lrp/AsnC family leucine-responsive transcriptional regulator
VLQTLAEKYGVRITGAELVVTTRFEAHGRRHLAPAVRVPSFSMSGAPEGDPLDSLEITILRVMARGEYRSLRDLARGIKQSSATVTRKVRQLEDRGIIQGYLLRLNPELIRLSHYLLFVQAPGKSAANRKAIEGFIKQHPEVINSSDCLGAWNHVFTVEVQSVKRLEQIRDSLIEELSLAGAGPITVRIAQIAQHEKFAPFPL